MICMSYSFFFYCYGDHRNLHSFPTRRSSDLSRGGDGGQAFSGGARARIDSRAGGADWRHRVFDPARGDRKSTRLNSSHPSISYAVFCLKKKNKHQPSYKLISAPSNIWCDTTL